MPEVCSIFCATANPVEVVVAETELGRGVLGVIDGLRRRGRKRAGRRVAHGFPAQNRLQAVMISSQEQLEDILSQPSDADRKAMDELPGDLLILGVAGKMGPSLALGRGAPATRRA